MPRDKDLKRLVRARMRKTGEAYTTARAHLLAKGSSKKPPAPPAKAAPAASATRANPKNYARLAGMTDATLKAKTGCTWERWVHALDHHGASRMPHRDIAALVAEKYKVDGWWSQTVAVGYERIRGLRALGQKCDGTYEMSKSRTYSVPVATLYAAWADAGVRRRWLDGATVRVRTATPYKSMRLDWDDRGILAVGFLAKGAAKSAVAVAHAKLPDRAAVERLKRYWTERLAALAEVLGEMSERD